MGILRMILLIVRFPQLPEGWGHPTCHGRLVDLCVIVGAMVRSVSARTPTTGSRCRAAPAAATVTHNIVSPVTLVGAVGNEYACGNNNTHHCCTMRKLNTCWYMVGKDYFIMTAHFLINWGHSGSILPLECLLPTFGLRLCRLSSTR